MKNAFNYKRLVTFIVLLATLGTATFYSLDFIFLHMGSKIPAPDNINSSEINFYAMGDQGSGSYRQYLTAAKMELSCQKDRDVNFALLLGDNFYWDGVESIKDEKFSKLFEKAYGSRCLLGMPFYSLLGNHDYKKNAQAQVEYSHQKLGSGRWNMPDTTYIKDFGKVAGTTLIRLVVLDTTHPMDDQIELLNKAFNDGQKVIWKMVASHVPIRSFSKKYGDDAYLVKTLLPTLKLLGVHFIFSGHAHNLQLIQKNDEPIHVISGAGGKRPRALVDMNNPDLLFGKQQNGFVSVHIKNDNLVLRFITLFSEKAFQISHQCAEQKGENNCILDIS